MNGERCLQRRIATVALMAGFIAPGVISGTAHCAPDERAGTARIENVQQIAIARDVKAPSKQPGGGLQYFGNGEVAVLFRRAASEGVATHAAMVLRRSLDGGATWPAGQETVVLPGGLTHDQQFDFLSKDPGSRKILDMSRPETMFLFDTAAVWAKKSAAQSTAGWASLLRKTTVPKGLKAGVDPAPGLLFQVRSADKGKTWESAPFIVDLPASSVRSMQRDNHPPAIMPDGSFVISVIGDDALWIYGSESHGMTWQLLSRPVQASPAMGKPVSGALVAMPSGRLQCYVLMRGAAGSGLYLTESENCYSWSVPRLVVADIENAWPLRLRDGRIMLAYSRVRQPSGIAAIVSADHGRNWSGEAMVHPGPEGAVRDWIAATEMENGRILLAHQSRARESSAAASVACSVFDLAAPAAAVRVEAKALPQAPLRKVEHIVVDYDKGRYAGHPRQQGGIWNFGNGEIGVMYRRAICKYETPEDVSHSHSTGYMSRSDIVLRRSLDHGKSWLPENETIVWSNGIPLEKKEAFFAQDAKKRSRLDMSGPGAMIFWGSSYMPSEVRARLKVSSAFQIRSIDKGRTWESVPLSLPSWGYPPQVRMADGRLAALIGSNPWLYVSADDAMSWERGSQILPAGDDGGRASYFGLLALPDGRLQCYMLMVRGPFVGLAMTETRDLRTWTEPRPIVRYGHSVRASVPWTESSYARRIAFGGWGQLYRSPWPLRLKDGRIAVLFARRELPPSILAIVSADGGKTWSDEYVIRDDANGSDIGYTVGTQLEDGRIFVAYYYQLDDGNNFGGTRFIGGSFFELP